MRGWGLQTGLRTEIWTVNRSHAAPLGQLSRNRSLKVTSVPAFRLATTAQPQAHKEAALNQMNSISRFPLLLCGDCASRRAREQSRSRSLLTDTQRPVTSRIFFSKDEEANGHRTGQGSETGEHVEGAVISESLDHVQGEAAHAKQEDATECADDNEHRARALMLGVEQVGDGNIVGANERKNESRDGPDVDQPVVWVRMGGRLAIKDSGEHTDDEGQSERYQTCLGLVDASAAVGEPLDDSIATVAKDRQCSERGDDLSGVGITDGLARPVVRCAADEPAIGQPNGDVGAQRNTVDEQRPEVPEATAWVHESRKTNPSLAPLGLPTQRRRLERSVRGS